LLRESSSLGTWLCTVVNTSSGHWVVIFASWSWVVGSWGVMLEWLAGSSDDLVLSGLVLLAVWLNKIVAWLGHLLFLFIIGHILGHFGSSLSLLESVLIFVSLSKGSCLWGGGGLCLWTGVNTSLGQWVVVSSWWSTIGCWGVMLEWLVGSSNELVLGSSGLLAEWLNSIVAWLGCPLNLSKGGLSSGVDS